MDLYILEHYLGSYKMVNFLLTQDYFFTKIEKDYNLQYEYTHQMDTYLCNMDNCDGCKENLYSSNKNMAIWLI